VCVCACLALICQTHGSTVDSRPNAWTVTVKLNFTKVCKPYQEVADPVSRQTDQDNNITKVTEHNVVLVNDLYLTWGSGGWAHVAFS
jgi:hypothetical protein